MALAQRKPQRLKEYDYGQNGCYYITICTRNKVCLFGEVSDGKMKTNQFGIIAQENIKKMASLFDDIYVDVFIVMPNHVHLILTIKNKDVEQVPHAARTNARLSKIVQSFKSSVTKELRKTIETSAASPNNGFGTVETCHVPEDGKIWQKSFYDHIIRNENDFLEIWQYIESNAQKWEMDRLKTQ